MIRKFQPQDTDKIMKIWLESSLDSHDFIPASYWQKNFASVRDDYLPGSTTYVWEENGEIKAFASLKEEDKLGALFVAASARGRGIGKALMFELQKNHNRLNLQVYSQNKKAVRFYHRCGFQILREDIDTATGAPELLMSWNKGNVTGDLIYNYSRTANFQSSNK